MTLELQENLISEQEFTFIFNDSITVKKSNEIFLLIAQRFNYIIYTIAKLTDREVNWYDYDNEGGEYAPGHFDIEQYKDSTDYTGEFYNKAKDRFEKYDYTFPTAWFYTQFETTLIAQRQAYFEEKEKKALAQKNKIQEINEKTLEIQKQIQAKLTPEEMCYINFAPEEQINKKFKLYDVEKYKAMKKKEII